MRQEPPYCQGEQYIDEQQCHHQGEAALWAWEASMHNGGDGHRIERASRAGKEQSGLVVSLWYRASLSEWQGSILWGKGDLNGAAQNYRSDHFL